MEEVQLVVIGAGPGGYAAAFRAADRGLDVALVDAAPRPGGVCLHAGCIPSKALLHVARLLREARAAHAWGVGFGEPEIDLDRLRAWRDEVVGALAGGLEQGAKGKKVPIHHARTSFTGSHDLALEPLGDGAPTKLRFEHALIATGSRPAAPGALRIDDERVMDSTAALRLDNVPERLLVVGGGYIGLELGQVYAALGARVSVVERTGGLLPGVDRELVEPLCRALDDDLDALWLSTEVESLTPGDAGVQARLDGPGVEPERIFDRVLVAVGREPALDGLGLENTGVRTTDAGFVEVDAARRTTDPAILAIGDAAGEPMLAHTAAREGKVAVDALVDGTARFDNRAIPAVVFTDPEIAWCGRTDGDGARVVRVPWSTSGRAHTLGRTDGVTKLVFETETKRLLGMGVAGPGAGELIAEGCLAVEMGAVAGDLAGTIHAHPTLAETIAEAAERA